MGAYKQTLTDLTGYLGLGSLITLGGFLILDGLFFIQPLIEHYAATKTWGAFVVIPTLVIAYLLGVFTVTVADLALESKYEKIFSQKELFSIVALSNNETLIEKFVDLERVRKLLSGASVAFLVLALGSLAEKNNIPGNEEIAYVGFVLGVISMAVCPYIAFSQYRKTVDLVQHFTSHNNSIQLTAKAAAD